METLHVNEYTDRVQTKLKITEPPSKQDEEQAATHVKNDKPFNEFLQSLNIDDLGERLIHFGEDADLVKDLETHVIKPIEHQLPSKFAFPGEIVRIGSCVDTSKVGRVNEMDTLYVISSATCLTAEKCDNNSYRLHVYDGNKQVLVCPRKTQNDIADAVEACVAEWTWDKKTPLDHDGYLSPNFSGVRYCGPAATLLLVHKREEGDKTIRTPLSVDITATFHLPPELKNIMEGIEGKFNDVTKKMGRKILHLNGVHLVANVIDGTWMLTTAQLEAYLIRDLDDWAPVKRAFSCIKILSHDLSKINEHGIIAAIGSSGTGKDILKIAEQLKKSKEDKQRLPGIIIRLAHMFLSKEAAEGLGEIGKSDIGLNTAALKHVLLAEALKDPSTFLKAERATDLEDKVYELLEKAFHVLSEVNLEKTPLPTVPHALIDGAKINLFAVSKTSVINDNYRMLQLIVRKQCDMIFTNKFSKIWSLPVEIQADEDIIRTEPYIPVSPEDLKYAEYTYMVLMMDLSINPKKKKVPTATLR